ncbi:MAG: GWxTD domain-containing protein [Bacteroidetes bacterium]|nr:GWxTD domain-containing protein [Bacteroidota bacterium]
MKYLSFLLFFYYSILYAQYDKESLQPNNLISPPVVFEAVQYWSVGEDTIDLIIFYRINPSFLIFTKTGNPSQEHYEAKGELIIEITDSSDATVGRDYRPVRILRSSMPAGGVLQTDEIQGIFSFSLRKGFYRIIAEAKDKGSGKSFINRDMRIYTQSAPDSGLGISSVLLIEPIQADSSITMQTLFSPINQGGGIIIGQKGACIFQVVSSDTITDIKIDWKIQKKEEPWEEINLESHNANYTMRYGSVAGIENSKRITLAVKNGPARSRFIFASLPVEKLDAGTYSLTIELTQGTLKTVKESSFKVIWPNRPFSLSNFKIASDALSLIASEKEMDEISSFSAAKSRKAFKEFWHQRDPDTTNGYNSVMAEYYRRVDVSINRFSTANERDGYRTDRGRIFILYGSPTIINRLLKPDSAPAEIWTYEKLRKRFTFSDFGKNGNYILVKTENI